MKQVVITKVYEVRRSGKGYSETESMWFNADKAQERAEYLREMYKNSVHTTNFRVYEHSCGDYIFYTTED